jgi:hypothetical protein
MFFPVTLVTNDLLLKVAPHEVVNLVSSRPTSLDSPHLPHCLTVCFLATVIANNPPPRDLCEVSKSVDLIQCQPFSPPSMFDHALPHLSCFQQPPPHNSSSQGLKIGQFLSNVSGSSSPPSSFNNTHPHCSHFQQPLPQDGPSQRLLANRHPTNGLSLP